MTKEPKNKLFEYKIDIHVGRFSVSRGGWVGLDDLSL